MKKKIKALLTAALCLTSSITAIPANAAEVEVELAIKYKTDTFTYTSTPFYAGFKLSSPMSVKPDFMVLGEAYIDANPTEVYGYIVCGVNEWSEEAIYFVFAETVQEQFGDIELKKGDLFTLNDDWSVTAFCTYPQPIAPRSPGQEPFTWEYLGNGVDLFGEEFEKVIRMQQVFAHIDFYEEVSVESVWCSFDLLKDLPYVKGDVTVDDLLTITDCLAINKNLMAGTPLNSYATLAGDINENGMLDSADSLSILKEVLQITENFQ